MSTLIKALAQVLIGLFRYVVSVYLRLVKLQKGNPGCLQ